MQVVEADAGVGSEVASLLRAIGREAAAAGVSLSQPVDERIRRLAAERNELRRQLSSLREHARGAELQDEDPRALRSELATLLSFAKTLRADADAWRAVCDDALAELRRRRAEERRRREQWLAEHQELARRRDALQASIDEAAKGLARTNGGECRRTVPVLTLGEALTVCSVSVLSPRKWFRSWKLWVVTLDDSWDEVLVRRY